MPVNEPFSPDKPEKIVLDPQFLSQAQAEAERWPIVIKPGQNGPEVVFTGSPQFLSGVNGFGVTPEEAFTEAINALEFYFHDSLTRGIPLPNLELLSKPGVTAAGNGEGDPTLLDELVPLEVSASYEELMREPRFYVFLVNIEDDPDHPGTKSIATIPAFPEIRVTGVAADRPTMLKVTLDTAIRRVRALLDAGQPVPQNFQGAFYSEGPIIAFTIG